MRIRIAQAELLDDLAAHLRGRGFLVVRRDRHEIEAHPLNPVNGRYDRAKTDEALRQWRDQHPEREIQATRSPGHST